LLLSLPKRPESAEFPPNAALVPAKRTSENAPRRGFRRVRGGFSLSPHSEVRFRNNKPNLEFESSLQKRLTATVLSTYCERHDCAVCCSARGSGHRDRVGSRRSCGMWSRCGTRTATAASAARTQSCDRDQSDQTLPSPPGWNYHDCAEKCREQGAISPETISMFQACHGAAGGNRKHRISASADG